MNPSADPGVRPGEGGSAFETIELRGGRAFALRRHLARLARSLEALGAAPPPPEVLHDAVEHTAAAWGTAHGRLRLTVLLGPDGAASVTAVAGPMPATNSPATLITAPWPHGDRSLLGSAKTGAYGDHVAALALARRAGADEAVLVAPDGLVCECSTSNLVVAVDGVVVTPPLGPGVLAGVTRELLLAASERADHPIVQRPLHRDELATAQEAFLLSTARRVQPVRAIDDRALPSCPGPATERAARIWHEAYGSVSDP